jgi:DNA-binding NarL/FixJ family response regulator
MKEESLHILLVDDDDSFLQVSKIILESENNFEIETANSVNEAFNKLKTRSYDAVISDYEMPLKTGLDFLKELREQKNNIAFILFTCRDREEIEIKALNLGADQYVNKYGNTSPETVYGELADTIRELAMSKKPNLERVKKTLESRSSEIKREYKRK